MSTQDMSDQIVEQLNRYEDEQPGNQYNVWDHVILQLPGYDDGATPANQCTRFVANGVEYGYGQDGRWHRQ